MTQKYSLKNTRENVLESYVSKTKTDIEFELSKLIAGLSKLDLHPQIEYAVLSGGKRLRPLLVILSAESVGGNRDKVMSLALAFELMHTATLVHDDIIDQDKMRRGKPALHKKWTINDAILTGDALIALAVGLASGYGEIIMKTVAQCALELCDGEHIDITFSSKTMTDELYLRKIKEKSASLFRASAYCGALAGGGSSTEVQLLSKFGENFGIAYQLLDDLLDLTPEEGVVLKDLRGGRISLPLIHSYRNSSLDEKREIETILGILMSNDQPGDNTTVEDIFSIMHRKGSLNYCKKRMEHYLSQAVDNISGLENTKYKAYMIEMTKMLKTRD